MQKRPMLSRPEQTGVLQEDEETERPEGTRLPAGFHEFPARPNPTVQSSGETPATNHIQEELGQRHVGPRPRSSVQQTENSFIESAGSEDKVWSSKREKTVAVERKL